MQDAKGNDVDLSIYKGKVLLIVNVASQWYVVNLYLDAGIQNLSLHTPMEVTDLYAVVCCSGLTNSNYTEMAKLYEKYKGQGLIIFLCFLVECFIFVLIYFNLDLIIFPPCFWDCTSHKTRE